MGNDKILLKLHDSYMYQKGLPQNKMKIVESRRENSRYHKTHEHDIHYINI